MPSGTLCPQCGEAVMPYGKFFREAEARKTSRCSKCDVELKRKKSVWLLLASGAVVVASVVGVGVPFIFERWGVVAAAVFMILFTAGAILGLNIFGWLFIGWKLASPETSNSAQSEQTDNDSDSDQHRS